MRIKLKYILISFVTLLLGLFLGYFLVLWEVGKENQNLGAYCEAGDKRFWEVQSIDTMKYSRDLAREKIDNIEFDNIIEWQVKAIADTGATHIALGTPYDTEFIPFLERWVKFARKYDLKIWFRGNLSGWEEWFDYAKISRIEHIVGTQKFILNNPDLFEDGDIFSSCPECENGGPGDPRNNNKLDDYRRFLIDEYKITNESFEKIDKKVKANYFSMNGDVARLVMDPATTASLGGNITIDHYVGSGERLANDVAGYAYDSRGKVVLGEFGFPIPDIHGEASEEDQAEWINDAMARLLRAESLIGLNYWANVGASTALWNDDGQAQKGVKILTNYYSPIQICGRIVNELGLPLRDIKIDTGFSSGLSNNKGVFHLILPQNESLEVKINNKFYKINNNIVVIKKENKN